MQDPILYCVIKPPLASLGCDSYLNFLRFDGFGHCCQKGCRMSLAWGLSAFLMVRLALWVLERKTPQIESHFHFISSKA